jgi:hypothetical protein
LVDQFVAALAEPWARRWAAQIAGSALAFWAVGLVIFVSRLPAGGFTCPAHHAQGTLWCRIQQAGALGIGAAAVTVLAVVIGSALIVAALSARLVDVLAGDRQPYRGWTGAAVKPVTRWLLRRQIDRLGRIAAAGTPVPDRIPEVPPGRDRRRRSHRALASYAADRQADRAATVSLRHYPSTPGAIGLTRLGSALAAMNERIWRRHGLDLSVCWEPLLGVLPSDARDWLSRESTRVVLQGQNLIWAFAALAWASLMNSAWQALSWVVAMLVLLCVMYRGLCTAVENYCGLIEATVTIHRHRLYRALGVALPKTTTDEITAGTALSGYLAGFGSTELELSWPADDTAEPAIPANP